MLKPPQWLINILGEILWGYASILFWWLLSLEFHSFLKSDCFLLCTGHLSFAPPVPLFTLLHPPVCLRRLSYITCMGLCPLASGWWSPSRRSIPHSTPSKKLESKKYLLPKSQSTWLAFLPTQTSFWNCLPPRKMLWMFILTWFYLCGKKKSKGTQCFPWACNLLGLPQSISKSDWVFLHSLLHLSLLSISASPLSPLAQVSITSNLGYCLSFLTNLSSSKPCTSSWQVNLCKIAF